MATTQEISTTSAGVRVIFVWKVDRYEYAFSFDKNRMAAVENESLETPVFTDLHQQDELLFLSGMSGDRHWSMSIEPTEAGFALDVAVRAKSLVDKIGSVYKAEGWGPWKITGVEAEGTLVPAVEAIDEGQQGVIPMGDFNKTPVTIRYRYQIERA